ncbi:MAG TPA: alpha/beta hydrolase [Pirellulales bacterium]|nr:alpha/beta hydrolase [Pirellulales bacterium]
MNASLDRELAGATRAWLAAGRHVEVFGRQVFIFERPAPASAAEDTTCILLLHGYPTSSYDWRGVVERLPNNCHAIAPDFLGFGLSDKPEAYGYSLFGQADLVEEVVRQCGVSVAHVVSHDMGTSVHCELLARQAEGRLDFSLQTSTFLNGSMLQWMAHITPFQELLATNSTLPQAIDFCRTVMTGVYVDALRGLMQRPEAISATDAQVMEELLRYQDGQLRLPALAGYMRERYLHADRWIGALELATTPVQFVWADSDPIAHADLGRELAHRCPRATYHELAGLGHFLLIEDPAAVAEKIVSFTSA